MIRVIRDPDRGRYRILYAVVHAPAGGVTVGGEPFQGGEFIPGEVMAKATPAEKAALRPGAAPAPAATGAAPRQAPAPAGGKAPKIRAAATPLTAARRVGTGKEAAIVMADGRPAPAHIKPSMVPPDWSDVQVSTDPGSDVLVKARDKAGRTKTVYSDNFAMKTAAAKFARIHEMMQKAGAIHAQVQANRNSPDPAVRDAADVTWLIQEQATRPGSDVDTKARVKAYGATTLRAEHVMQDPDGTVRLRFVGKEGIAHDHAIRDPGLAKMLLERKGTAEARGGRLFATNYDKLNAYVASLDGGQFTPKDFRTLRATRLAAEHIAAVGACCGSPKEYKARVKEIAEKVSHVLGNRPEQALTSYINPTVFSVWGHPGNA